MPIQDADLFLIEDTSGVSKKITASKLKANLAANTYNNHKLLVNKPDYTSRFVYAQNMQGSVSPTDYMMVERSGVSYKVTGQQIIDYFPSAPAGAAGPIVDVTNGVTTSYSDTVTEPHSKGATDNSVLFNGEFTGKYNAKNVGSRDLANRTTIVPFTPSLVGAAKLVCFVGGGGTTITIRHENGDTQLIYNGFNGINLVDITINSSSPITQIELEGSNSNSSWISGFKDINGNPIVAGAPTSELTLASDDNLDTFTVGDSINMVDSNGDVASYTPVTSTIASVSTVIATNYNCKGSGDIGNGNLNPNTNNVSWSTGIVRGSNLPVGSAITSNGTDSIRMVQASSPAGATGLAFGLIGGYDQDIPRFELWESDTGEAGTWVRKESSDSTGLWTGDQLDAGVYFNTEFGCVSLLSAVFTSANWTCTAGQSQNTLTFEDTIAENPDLKYFRAGDVVQGSADVVKTNLNTNTMVVSGGAWTGSDGTSSGDAADRETVVTGPAKSGTGNFSSNTGPVVDVSNSNQQWIDNQNRLGENFFIKAASTRTGLAVLRAKAAQLATEFELGNTYQTGDLVIYEDAYWVRDNTSWLKISDSTTTY